MVYISCFLIFGCPYLPYWDHATDSQEPVDSVVLSEAYFGVPGANGQIINGPFRREEYITPVGGSPLNRGYDPSGTDAFYAQVLKTDFEFTPRV
jgi:hypothetical protein